MKIIPLLTLVIAISTFSKCGSTRVSVYEIESGGTIIKQLICELPKDFYKNYTRYNSYKHPNKLMLCGSRYAYIYRQDTNSYVLNMNGTKVKGHFERWDTPIMCGTGMDWERREKEKYKRVAYEASLTTFGITNKKGKLVTYIDGKKADNSQYKTHPLKADGVLEIIDESMYILRKEGVSNFYYKGVKGPDFKRISRGVRYNSQKGSYIYSAETDPAGYKTYAVVDGTPIYAFPHSRNFTNGMLRYSRYGEPYFTYKIDTGGSYQGYGFWINGTAYPCQGIPGEIVFSDKGSFKFISRLNDTTYYLNYPYTASGPYRFAGFKNDNLRLSDSKMVLVSSDSIYCYERDSLIYKSKFTLAGRHLHLRFTSSQDHKTIVIRGQAGRISFFVINGQLHIESRYDPELRDLSKWFGFSDTKNKFAYKDYIVDEKTGWNKWANLYVNDSLIGKFPRTIKLFWLDKDNYRLSAHVGEEIARRNSSREWDKTRYQEVLEEYFDGVAPPFIDQIQPWDDRFKAGPIWGTEERYIRTRKGSILRGRFIEHLGKRIKVAIYNNNSIYYTLENDHQTWLYVDFELKYTAYKIFFPIEPKNSLRFHAIEGNKVYLVEYKPALTL